ncbi:uncharacterized protein LOC105837325 isoform X1 [Monomorium pharaonis]|uniref:uncharacterized protein LOC105837325 isoform X1 n=1 Tax=Monomorium pharaonis TaxID=307658 RepID=UPI00063EE2AF|nr:uncharacterized protein LOC105837325 isoform X1 [Monomorium pharaonis]
MTRKRNEKTVVLPELEQRKRRRRAADCRRGEYGRGGSGALPHGIAAAMCRSRLAVLESLSAVAVEGRQEAFLADAAVHIRDNRIPGATVERARRRRFRSIGEGGCLPGDALADPGTAARRPAAFRRHDLQGADHPVRPQSPRVHRRVSHGRRHQDITEPARLLHRVDRPAQQQREHAQFAARHYGRHRRDQGQKARSSLIVLVHASQVRLKMYKTPSRERVCEIQPLEGNSSATQKYIQHQKRRFSEFSASVAASTSTLRRRASEMTRPLSDIEIPGTRAAGITCSNTDLISILSSLTSSATEINMYGTSDTPSAKDEQQKSSWSTKTAEQRRSRLKSSRSNSFDVSILHSTKSKTPTTSSSSGSGGKNSSPIGALMAPSSWFAKRHQPISRKSRYDEENATLAYKLEKSRVVKTVKDTIVNSRHKVLWDDSSGTKVDAQVLGNAIEKILTSGHRGNDAEASGSSSGKPAVSPNKSRASKVASWFTSGNKEQEQPDCESICSTLKDLFVK